MTTIRRAARPVDRFTMISNDFHRDTRLSLAARGLGGYLLSHVDGWEITVQRLATEQGVGREQMRKILRELEDVGYLRRTQSRDEHGLMGAMVYQVSCTPMEPKSPGHSRCPENRTPVNRATVSDHHKKNSSKNNIATEEQPSGGSLRETADPPKDSDMNRRTPPDALPLEFTDGQETMKIRGRRNGKTTASQGAETVVAAYVDAYRRHHFGTDPAKSSKGRVARDAAQLLAAGTKHEVMLQAAAAMGATPYANLPVQVSMLQRSTPSKGVAPIAPVGSFDQAAAERHARFLEEVRTDPDAAAWVARDPAQVAKLIAEDPTLAPVFARLGAA